MKNKGIIALFAIGLFLLIAVITNPDQDRHEEVIKEKFNSYMQKSMTEGLSETDNGWEALGMALGVAMVNGIISNIVTTDNYVIFSVTKITWAGESKVIGVGAFGNVFLNGKLDEALDEGLLNE